MIGTLYFLGPSLDMTFLSVKILKDGRTNPSSENVKIQNVAEFYFISNL